MPCASVWARDASAAEGIEAFLATTGLADESLRRARQGLRANVEADAAGAAEQQSLEWLWTQDEYDDAYFGDLPRNGYVSVVEAMASGLDVRLDWPVARVDLTDDGVRLVGSGQTETGSHVVVAVPLGVLKSGCPPSRRRCRPSGLRSCARLGFGRYEKVVLKFAEALLARRRVVAPGPLPAGSRRTCGVGVRSGRVRRRPDPRLPRVPLRHRARLRVIAGQGRRAG